MPLIGKPVATCFTRDGLSRLAHAWTTEQTDCSDGSSTLTHDGPSGFNQSWTYSPDGNAASARSLLINRTFSYNDSNHPHAVTRAGADVFGYDAAGQQNSRIKTLKPGVLTYTPLHQLSTVVSGIETTKMVYAADGTRLVRLNPDATANLYIDGQEVLIVAGIAKGIRYYTQDRTVVAQRLISGKLAWQLSDTQGSAQIAVLSGTGVPIRTYYDPYGKVRDLSPQPATDRGFLGKPYDPGTGLNTLSERAYDADLGRFVSPDPLAVRDSAQSANPYAYAANDPIRFSDPSGLRPVPDGGGGSTPAPLSLTPPPPPCTIAAPGTPCTIYPPPSSGGSAGTAAVSAAAAAGLIAVTTPSGLAKTASFDDTVKIVTDFFTKYPWANGQTTVLLADVQLADGRNKTLVFLNGADPKPELLQQLRQANVEVYQASPGNPDNHAERVAQQYKAQVEAEIAAGQRPAGDRISYVSRFGVTNKTCGAACASALSEFAGRPIEVGSRGDPGFGRTGRLLKWLGPLGEAGFVLSAILQFDQGLEDLHDGIIRNPITGEIENQQEVT